MRKLRKQPVGRFSSRNHNAEPGERYYIPDHENENAKMIDLRESTGWGKRNLGELTPHTVKKNGKPRKAVLADDGLWYWED